MRIEELLDKHITSLQPDELEVVYRYMKTLNNISVVPKVFVVMLHDEAKSDDQTDVGYGTPHRVFWNQADALYFLVKKRAAFRKDPNYVVNFDSAESDWFQYWEKDGNLLGSYRKTFWVTEKEIR